MTLQLIKVTFYFLSKFKRKADLYSSRRSKSSSSLQNSNNPVYRRIYEHMERTKSFVSSMDEGVRRAKEGNYAFIGESVSLDLAVARYCELVRTHEVVGMRGYSIAAALGEAVELEDGSLLPKLTY